MACVTCVVLGKGVTYWHTLLVVSEVRHNSLLCHRYRGNSLAYITGGVLGTGVTHWHILLVVSEVQG